MKVKVVVYSPDINDHAYSADFTFPLARWSPVQFATIAQTFDLCTRYSLQLGGPRKRVECEVYLTLLHMTSAGN